MITDSDRYEVRSSQGRWSFYTEFKKKKPPGRELGQRTLKLETELLLKGTLDKLTGFFSV